MLRMALLNTASNYTRTSYRLGDFYNSVFMVTREQTGLPADTSINMVDGTSTKLQEIGRKIEKEKLGGYTITFGTTIYVPLTKTLKVWTMGKRGKKEATNIAAFITSTGSPSYFLKLRTESGAELVCDPQRGLYVKQGSSRRIVRADKLRIGMKILKYDEQSKRFIQDRIIAVEKLH